MNDSPRFLELSHRIEADLVTYPGLPPPRISDYLSFEASAARYAPGTEFHIGRIDMIANTGTYIDSPAHRYRGRSDIADLPLAALADLPCTVIRLPGSGGAVEPAVLDGARIQGRAVLFHGGWSRFWGTRGYFEGFPWLTAATARLLAEAGATLVGIDSMNIDNPDDPARPAHTILLGADIPIVEHLTNLDQLPAGGSRFFAAPVRVRGMGSFPVRAFAILP